MSNLIARLPARCALLLALGLLFVLFNGGKVYWPQPANRIDGFIQLLLP